MCEREKERDREIMFVRVSRKERDRDCVCVRANVMCHREREVDEECGCCYVYLCVCQLVSQLGRNVMGVHVSGCACLRGSVCLRACVRRCVLESTVVFKFSLHVDLSQEMKSISIPESD